MSGLVRLGFLLVVLALLFEPIKSDLCIEAAKKQGVVLTKNNNGMYQCETGSGKIECVVQNNKVTKFSTTCNGVSKPALGMGAAMAVFMAIFGRYL